MRNLTDLFDNALSLFFGIVELMETRAGGNSQLKQALSLFFGIVELMETQTRALKLHLLQLARSLFFGIVELMETSPIKHIDKRACNAMSLFFGIVELMETNFANPKNPQSGFVAILRNSGINGNHLWLNDLALSV